MRAEHLPTDSRPLVTHHPIRAEVGRACGAKKVRLMSRLRARREVRAWDDAPIMEDILDNPEFITTATEKQHAEADDPGMLEPELQQVVKGLSGC